MSALTAVLVALLAITATLALGLVALVVRRLRQNDAGPAVATSQDDEAWLRDVLAERQTQVDGELIEENQRLEERVRFLEAKVLELEIREQEINALPAMRQENKALREELRRLHDALSAQTAPTPSAASTR